MKDIYTSFFKETEKFFANSSVVKYWPYIGKEYFKSSIKIMILGESHYLRNQNEREKMEKYPWWTNDVVVSEYLGQEYTRSFDSFADFPKCIPFSKGSHLKGFRNTAKMLAHSGDHCSDYVWDRLAFYNFFQKPVAPCPGSHEWLEADYENYINQAREALDEVIKKLKPDIVIIWGKGKLNKRWLPANKEQLYPNVTFFPINHPSYNIKQKCIDEWKNFVSRRNISEDFAKHHACYKKIESLYLDLKGQKEILSLFDRWWFGERSIGFELYQEWNCTNKRFEQNSLNEGKSTSIILLFIMKENGESSIILSTRYENDAETIKIINNSLLKSFNNIHNLHRDGLFELYEMSSETSDEEILTNIKAVLQAVSSYRKNLKHL